MEVAILRDGECETFSVVPVIEGGKCREHGVVARIICEKEGLAIELTEDEAWMAAFEAMPTSGKGPSSIPGIGPTGSFPRGKIAPSDAGEFLYGVTTMGDVIVLDFRPSGVKWIGFPPEEARSLATVLLKRADEIEGKSGN